MRHSHLTTDGRKSKEYKN